MLEKAKKPRFQAFGLLAVTDQPLGEELVRFIGNPNDTDVRDPWEKDHSVAQTGRQALNRASHECKVRQGQIIQQHRTRERLGNGIHGCDTHVGGRDIVDQLHFLLERSHEPVHRSKWSNTKPDNTQPFPESEGHMTRDHKVTCNHTSS